MAKLDVKTVKQKSVVTDKDQHYVIIGDGENRVVIGVGLKTYEGVTGLLMEPKPQKDGKPILKP